MSLTPWQGGGTYNKKTIASNDIWKIRVEFLYAHNKIYMYIQWYKIDSGFMITV